MIREWKGEGGRRGRGVTGERERRGCEKEMGRRDKNKSRGSK